MKCKRNHKALFIASLTFMFLFSASFLIMPLASALSFGGNNILLMVTGLWFWLTAILSGVTFLLANRNRKSVSTDNRSRPGILCFCLNPWAKIADCAFGASLLGLTVTILFALQNNFVFILASLSVFSFLLHCVLNGKNFKFLTETMNQTKYTSKGEVEK